MQSSQTSAKKQQSSQPSSQKSKQPAPAAVPAKRESSQFGSKEPKSHAQKAKTVVDQQKPKENERKNKRESGSSVEKKGASATAVNTGKTKSQAQPSAPIQQPQIKGPQGQGTTAGSQQSKIAKATSDAKKQQSVDKNQRKQQVEEKKQKAKSTSPVRRAKHTQKVPAQDKQTKKSPSPATKRGRKIEKTKEISDHESDSDSDNTASVDFQKRKGKRNAKQAKKEESSSSQQSSSGSESDSKQSSQDSHEENSDDEKKDMKVKPLMKNNKLPNESDEEMKDESVDNHVLYSRVIKADQRDKRLSMKPPRDLDDQELPENTVCLVCYQSTILPKTKSSNEDTDNVEMKDLEHDSSPTDAQMLYQLAFCKSCFSVAHWNCIGTDTELFEQKTKKGCHYYFECDKCQYKHLQQNQPTKYKFNYGIQGCNTNPHCLVCEKEEGILRAFEIGQKSGKSTDDTNACSYIGFFHYVCAWSFQNVFKLQANSDRLTFSLIKDTLDNQVILDKKDRSKKSKACALCKSSHGLMVQDNDKTGFAHPFCVRENQYIAEESSANESYEWCMQVLLNKEKDFQPEIHFYSSNKQLKHCICDTPHSGSMIECESCKVWYHLECDEEYISQTQSFQCIKCKYWVRHLEDNLIAMLLQKKKFSDLLNNEGIYWKGFDSLCNYVEDSDRAMEVPVRIIEHSVLVKTWHVLQQYMEKETVQEAHYSYHIQEASYLFPIIDVSSAQKDLENRKKIIENIIQDNCDEMNLKDIASDNNSPKSLSQLQKDKKDAIIKHNKKAGAKAKEVVDKCIQEAKLINESVDILRKIGPKSEVLLQAFTLLGKNDKPPLQQVRELCDKIDELEMSQEGFQSINTIMDMMHEYEEWNKRSLDELLKKTPTEEKIKERIESIKNSRIGLKRHEALLRMFKEYLSSKPTLAQAKNIIDKSSNLRVDVTDERIHLDQLCFIIEKLEKDYDLILKDPSHFKNPSLKSQEFLIQQCCFPFKSLKVDEVFERWNLSQIWKVKAQAFLQPKLTEEQRDEIKAFRMEVDQETPEGRERRENSFSTNDYVWTLSRAQELLNEIRTAEANKKPYFIDLKLQNQVKEKVNAIEALKQVIKDALKSERDRIKELKQYKKQMEEMETVDFVAEINQVNQKIKLLNEITRIAHNDDKRKFSIDQIQEAFDLIQRLEDENRGKKLSTQFKIAYQICIDSVLKNMLQSKLAEAKKLKTEFKEIMETQYQNTFNKNMVSQLKQIVQRAEQEFFIDMKEEQRTIDNIPYSEEWFLSTYEKLKGIAGKALHTVDFKSFVQLSTVLKEEKDCVILLKGLIKSHKTLEGAALNLWRSISGVKWIFEAKRLLHMNDSQPKPGQISTQSDEIELKKVIELDTRAREELNFNYEREIEQGHMYSQLFADFKKIVDCIEMFKRRFGSYHKLVQTLEQNMNRLEDFKLECDNLTQILQNHKITSQSGELELLSKIHTYVDFLQQYQKLTAPPTEDIQPEQKPKMLQYEKALQLQSIARDHNIPQDISILKELNDSVMRFQKFQREYTDYKRYRERVLKRKAEGGQLVSAQALVETRFTCEFVKKLIEEYANLRIAHSQNEQSSLADEDEDLYFNKAMLEQDLITHEEWRGKADVVLNKLEDDELAVAKDEALKDQFSTIKESMSNLPLYDKEIFLRMKVFEWLFHCDEILAKNSNDPEAMNIQGWEAKLNQAETYISQLQQYHQYQIQTALQAGGQINPSQTQLVTLLKNLKNHSIYQRVAWEVDQAKSVIEFVAQLKTTVKATGAKYNYNDSIKQQAFHVTTFFRSKQTRQKVDKMLDQAKRSKVIIHDEIRALDNWLKDYDNYKNQFDQGTLFSNNSFDRLKDIARIMYLSPIDMSEIYLKLKPRLETAEAIRLDLKRIVQDHEFAQLQRQAQDRDGGHRPFKRLRYSRIGDSLAIFDKDCQIPGVKEIENLQQKVNKSIDRLAEAQNLLQNLSSESDEIREQIEAAKSIITEVEIDMEKKELNVKRQIFELELRHILFAHKLQKDVEQPLKKVELDEFKLVYERDYDHLEQLLKDEQVHALFIETRDKVNEYLRRINKIEKKEELQSLREEIQKELPFIDFTQTLADVEAQVVLGKRANVQFRKDSSASEESKEKDSSSSEVEEPSDIAKRRKLNPEVAVKKVGAKNAKQSESSSSSSSSEGSSSGSESDSEGDSSSSESQKSEVTKKVNKKQEAPNIAQTRERRVQPKKLDEDFIYDNPLPQGQKKVDAKKKQEEAKKKPIKKKPAQNDESSSSSGSSSGSESDDEGSSSSSSSSSSESETDQKRKRAIQLKKKQIQRQYNDHQRSKQAVVGRYPVEQDDEEDPFARGVVKKEIAMPGQTMLEQIQNDKLLQNTLQQMKQRKRQDARNKLKATITNKETIFSKLSEEEVKTLVNDFEEETFKKHPECDMYYQKRIDEVCNNILFLKDYKDIQELFVTKRTYSMGKLMQNHHAFKDDMIKLNQKIVERRKYLKELSRQQKAQQPPPVKPVQQQAAEQKIEQPLQPHMIEIPQNFVKTQVQEEQKSQKMTIQPESDDEIQSCGSNQALFSDDEEDAHKNPIQTMEQIMNKAKQNPRVQKPQPFDPNAIKKRLQQNQQTPQSQSQFQQVQPITYSEQALTQPYNPFEVFEIRHLGMVNGMVNPYIPRKPSEPVLYNPMQPHLQKQEQINTMTSAPPPGSLLHVWDGSLELAKDQTIRCSMYSTMEIENFFLLPQMPAVLNLKGKAKLQDVTSHFQRLKRDKKLLRGWFSRKGSLNQDNSDKYTKLFEELDSSQRSALFNVFSNITLYIVPITPKTKQFCQEMGVDPEQCFRKQDIFDQTQERKEDEIKNLQEETHLYAFFSQIKQTFEMKSSTLIPEVIRYALPRQEIVQPQVKRQNDANFSPLSSDDEREAKRQRKIALSQAIGQPVKQEDQYHQMQLGGYPQMNQNLQSQQTVRGRDPRLAAQQNIPVKQNDEPMQQMSTHQVPQIKQEQGGDYINIDQLIEGFKNKAYSIPVIQEKLMSIIHLVQGEDEIKLTRFLTELIHQLNGNQSTPGTNIDEQTPQQSLQDPTNLGYSYPANLGQSIPQYPYSIPPGPPGFGGFQPQMMQQNFRQQFPQQQGFGSAPGMPNQASPPQFFNQVPSAIGVMYPGAPQQQMFPGAAVGAPDLLMGHPQGMIRPPPLGQNQMHQQMRNQGFYPGSNNQGQDRR